MKPVIIHSKKYNCKAVFIRDSLFVQRLAKLLIKMMVEDNSKLKELPETRTVLLKFIPLWLKAAVEKEITTYLASNDEMHLEGFIEFRLSKQAHDLKTAIDSTMRQQLRINYIY